MKTHLALDWNKVLTSVPPEMSSPPFQCPGLCPLSLFFYRTFPGKSSDLLCREGWGLWRKDRPCYWVTLVWLSPTALTRHHLLSICYLSIYLSIYRREEQQMDRAKENPKQTPCWEWRLTEDSVPWPWNHDLSSNKSQMLNWLSHSCTPHFFLSISNSVPLLWSNEAYSMSLPFSGLHLYPTVSTIQLSFLTHQISHFWS